MKVLIPTWIFPPEIGGPATYVRHMAQVLAGRGHKVRVVTLSPAAGHPDEGYPFQVVRLAPAAGRARRWAGALACLRGLLRDSDVAFVNGLVAETVLAALGTGCPLAAKVVGDTAWEGARNKGWTGDEFARFQQRRYGLGVEVRRRLRNWALSRMRRIIVPSEYLARTVAGWGVDPGRIEVVYNAYTTPKTQPPAAELPLDTRWRLVTVGRLIDIKGVDALIEMTAAMPDAGLVVVGEGPEGPALEALAQRLGVESRVHFTGPVGPERVWAYLKACHLFVLNSRHEGLPHVVLEALAAGLPVVATAVGGTPEALRDGVDGRLVLVDDPQALHGAVREWLEKGGGHADLAEKFSARRMEEETLAILEQTARDRER